MFRMRAISCITSSGPVVPLHTSTQTNGTGGHTTLSFSPTHKALVGRSFLPLATDSIASTRATPPVQVTVQPGGHLLSLKKYLVLNAKQYSCRASSIHDDTKRGPGGTKKGSNGTSQCLCGRRHCLAPLHVWNAFFHTDIGRSSATREAPTCPSETRG